MAFVQGAGNFGALQWQPRDVKFGKGGKGELKHGKTAQVKGGDNGKGFPKMGLHIQPQGAFGIRPMGNPQPVHLDIAKHGKAPAANQWKDAPGGNQKPFDKNAYMQEAQARKEVVKKEVEKKSESVVQQRDTTLEELAQMNLNDGDREGESPVSDVYFLQLPPGIEYETWISLKMREAVFELEILVNSMFRRKEKYRSNFGIDSMNLCNVECCPTMKAGEFHSYSWSDGMPGSSSEMIPAPAYIANFLKYARDLLADTYMFPTNFDACVRADEELKRGYNWDIDWTDDWTQSQPPRRNSAPHAPKGAWVDPRHRWENQQQAWGNYWETEGQNNDWNTWQYQDSRDGEWGNGHRRHTVDGELPGVKPSSSAHPEFDHYLKQIMRRLYRIYCHIIRHHSYQLEVCNIFETMLKGFKRMLLTALLFDLLPEVELNAVAPFVDQARELLQRADEAAEQMHTDNNAMWKGVVAYNTDYMQYHRAERQDNSNKIRRMGYHAYEQQYAYPTHHQPVAQTPERRERDPQPGSTEKQIRYQ